MALATYTTRIEILDLAPSDVDAEPYYGDDASRRVVTATGVRAVIGAPAGSGTSAGTEKVAGGEELSSHYSLNCDPVAISHTSWVRDMTTGTVYRVVYAELRSAFGVSMVQGQLVRYDGLV